MDEGSFTIYLAVDLGHQPILVRGHDDVPITISVDVAPGSTSDLQVPPPDSSESLK